MIQKNEIHTIIYSCQQGNKNKSITNIFKQQLERLKIIYTHSVVIWQLYFPYAKYKIYFCVCYY